MWLVERFVDLPGGVRLPYVEQGDPGGIPVLLLHGVTDSWRSFGPTLARLPESIRAFALTQRGHGGATRPRTGYRYRDFAADVVAFLDAFEIPAALVVGHSMGSVVAQRFAIDHPARTRGLVLAGSFAALHDNPGVREMWDADVSKLEDPIDPGFVRAFQQSTLAQPVPAPFFEMAVAESLLVPARVWRAIFEGFLHEDHGAELGRIAAPTRIIWGDRDAICTRDDQTALLRAIRGSQLSVYANAGHAMHWEDPERFATEVAEFVASAGASAGSDSKRGVEARSSAN
jgi:pimeloyl-ACP methyl ester carboxylesterase